MKKTGEIIFINKEADKYQMFVLAMLAFITISSVVQSRYVAKIIEASTGPAYDIITTASILVFTVFLALFIWSMIQYSATAQFLHYDLSEKKIGTTKNANRYYFGQKNIDFIEIKKLTCNYINKFWGQAVIFNLQTSDGGALSLQQPFLANEGEYSRIRFISAVQAQSDFEVELVDFPPRFLEKLAKFQNGEKFSFWDKNADTIKYCLVAIFFVVIYIVCLRLLS